MKPYLVYDTVWDNGQNFHPLRVKNEAPLNIICFKKYPQNNQNCPKYPKMHFFFSIFCMIIPIYIYNKVYSLEKRKNNNI